MGNVKKCLLSFAISLILILSFINVVHAMDVSFAWDANSEQDVVGYYLYYKTGASGPPYDGTDALEGDSPIYVAGRITTTLTLTGLSDTEDYYFTVTAYDSEDLESGYSNEVVKYAVTPQYTLTVNSNGQGIVTPPGGTFDEGSAVDLTASPASGWTFDHWGGDVTGSINPVSITMNTDKTVTAHFAQLPPVQYTLTVNTIGQGIVTPPGGTFDEGSTVDLTASPASGWTFDHWSGDVTGSINPVSITMNGDKTVTAYFTELTPVQYTLTVNSNGQGIVTPPGGTFDEGSAVDLTASPASGWTFDHWSGDVTGSTSPVSITMNANKTVTAYFTEDDVAPFIQGYPSINRTQRTIDIAYSENQMQNATVEANYAFNPSLNFATSGDDITYIGANTYRLAMASIPSYTIIVLTVSNITDAVGHPVTPNSVRINDNDNDDMADDWENDYGVNHPALDPDADGLNNLEEYEKGTDPFDSDTDNDGLPDGWEVTYGLDPNNAIGVNGSDGDMDNDGWTNAEEYAAGTDSSDDTSTPDLTPPEILETTPHNGAGIIDNTRIANDASFAIYIEDADGIDMTDFSSIVFTINDGVNPSYSWDLGDTSVVRAIKLTNDDSAQVTKLWVVYDRVNDMYGAYPFDSDVNIKVDAKDRRDAWMNQASFDFNIESSNEHDDAQLGRPASVPVAPGDPALEDPYDAGIMITSGLLYGAKIIYDDDEPVKPTFGPTHEISELHVSGVGVPINLQPPTVFNTPVKIFIPYPGDRDVRALSVYVNKGQDWVLACDADGKVKPGGDGWMVPGSRVNHIDEDPAKIEIKVYHFTAVQTGATLDGPIDTSDESVESEKTGGSCFIDTAAGGLP